MACSVFSLTIAVAALGFTAGEDSASLLSSGADALRARAIHKHLMDPVDDDAGKEMNTEGVRVRVKGQSGKMTLTVPTENGTQDVDVEMIAFRELDIDGNVLGRGGKDKHSFNSFATQSFTIGDPYDSTYHNLSVQKVRFASALTAGNLSVETVVYKHAGKFNISEDTTVSVKKGSVEFSVKMGQWSWCGSDGVICKENAGDAASVELDLKIQGEGQPVPELKVTKTTKIGNETEVFELGGLITITMFNLFSTDNGISWIEMPEGYPKVNGNVFTLKFPKWEDSILYDPIVQSDSMTCTSTDCTTRGKNFNLFDLTTAGKGR